MLVRTAVNISAKITEAGRAVVGIARATVADGLVRGDDRNWGEVGNVHVAVQALVNASAGIAAGNAGARSKFRTQERRAACAEKCGGRARVKDGERSSRLENGDAANFPTAEERLLHAFAVLKERQGVNIADNKAMRTIEVRQSSRRIDVALIVVGGVERGVAS